MAGFQELPGRGKGSHSYWRHPLFRDLRATLAGRDGQDTQDYQEEQIAAIIAEVERRRK